jgi:hypothetical protein
LPLAVERRGLRFGVLVIATIWMITRGLSRCPMARHRVQRALALMPEAILHLGVRLTCLQPFLCAAVSSLVMILLPLGHVVWAKEDTTTVTGSAQVLDGDTLDIGTTRVRLYGIDAPEGAQRCTDRRGKEWACGRSATRPDASCSCSRPGRGTLPETLGKFRKEQRKLSSTTMALSR